MITVKVKLQNGLYEIYNGSNCDNYPYRALLVIAGDEIFVSAYTTGSFYGEVKPIVWDNIGDVGDLFEKLNVHGYNVFSAQ